jgi:hypothetical protein
MTKLLVMRTNEIQMLQVYGLKLLKVGTTLDGIAVCVSQRVHLDLQSVFHAKQLIRMLHLLPQLQPQKFLHKEEEPSCLQER